MRNRKRFPAQSKNMILGEMALLVTAVFVMCGVAKGITSRLRMNDYVTTFLIFVIVLLNVRGGVKLTESYSLSLGSILSVIVGSYTMIRRSDTLSEGIFALLSAAGCAGIVFAYSAHFLGEIKLDPRLVASLLSLLVGLWCAFAARRRFSSCLFAALFGGFLGSTLYLILFEKHGNIGGNYTFAVMWLGAIAGLVIQYLLTVLLRAVKSPRADSYFEAGEMKEEEKPEKRN